MRNDMDALGLTEPRTPAEASVNEWKMHKYRTLVRPVFAHAAERYSHPSGLWEPVVEQMTASEVLDIVYLCRTPGRGDQEDARPPADDPTGGGAHARMTPAPSIVYRSMDTHSVGMGVHRR